MKSSYLLACDETSDLDRTREHLRGSFWGKVWGLGMALKFQVFIWKVLQGVLATGEGLAKRKIEGNRACAFCRTNMETREHLFLNCEFSRRVWRASHLGFDFSVGDPDSFVDWFIRWLKEAPDKELIGDSILILWALWCERNNIVFRGLEASIDSVLQTFSGIKVLCRATPREKGDEEEEQKADEVPKKKLFKDHSWQHRLDRREDQESRWMVAIDGAWDAETGRGAAAWVKLSNNKEVMFEVKRSIASSATVVEIQAGILALERAVREGVRAICIKTDSLVFVQGLNSPSKAPICIKAALDDFCYLCKLMYDVKVVKVDRIEVKAAHAKAKASLAQL